MVSANSTQLRLASHQLYRSLTASACNNTNRRTLANSVETTPDTQRRAFQQTINVENSPTVSTQANSVENTPKTPSFFTYNSDSEQSQTTLSSLSRFLQRLSCSNSASLWTLDNIFFIAIIKMIQNFSNIKKNKLFKLLNRKSQSLYFNPYKNPRIKNKKPSYSWRISQFSINFKI